MYQPGMQPPRASGIAAHKLAVIVAALVVTVAVVAAAIFLPRLIGHTPSEAEPSSPPVTTSPTVSPAAPPPPQQSIFPDGMRVLTTWPTPNVGLIGATDNHVLAYAIGDFTHPLALDRTTGATVWEGQDGDCSMFLAASLICTVITGPDGSVDGMNLLDGQTGRVMGSLDTTAVGSQIRDYVTTSQGVLVIGVTDEAVANHTDDATLAYFTGPGEPKWTTPVVWTGLGSGLMPAQTFDEGDGLFAWHSVSDLYIVDQRTGFLVYQATTIFATAQIFAQRLVYIDYDPDTSNPVSDNGQPVAVPGGDPVTLMDYGQGDSWLLALGPGHPGNVVVLASSGYGAEAHDPGNQDWSQTLWRSPDWSGPDAWPNIMAIGWDGRNTAFAVSENGRVWAFDLTTGEVLWWGTFPPVSSQDWRVTVSASGGLVGIQASSEDFTATPTFTVLRADNGQPMPDLSGDWGTLKDGVLFTSTDDTSTVYVPA